MPHTRVVFYQEEPGNAPVVSWLMKLKHSDPKGWLNCRTRIEQLATFGHDLRRPASDMLREGIRELRARHLKVQYRILYFFVGQNVAILAHAIIKGGLEVGPEEIEKALVRKSKFLKNPKAHTYEEWEE